MSSKIKVLTDQFNSYTTSQILTIQLRVNAKNAEADPRKGPPAANKIKNLPSAYCLLCLHCILLMAMWQALIKQPRCWRTGFHAGGK